MSCQLKMRNCKLQCAHYQFVIDYRQERERQEQAAEDDSSEYAKPDITFHKWLQGSKRT